MARTPVKITDNSTRVVKVRNTVPDSTDLGLVVRTLGSITIANTTAARVPVTSTGTVSLSTSSLNKILALPTRADHFKTRSDTFTSTASGVTVNASSFPMAKYGIQVKGTGGVATSWDIRLEGSLNNAQFSQIVQHTNTAGDGAVVWSGANMSPSLYLRSRVAGLVLAPASDVVVTILGVV